MMSKKYFVYSSVILFVLGMLLFIFDLSIYSQPQRGGENSILDDIPKTKERLLVAHAMGSISTTTMDGTGSNSREAFLTSYENGFRLFEADISLSSDGVAVLVHDGSESWIGLPEGWVYSATTSSVILSKKFRGAFTLLSWHDVLVLLGQYPDTFLILDIKDDFLTMFDVLTKDVLFADESIRQRIIPQVYQESDVGIVSKYGFSDVIFTLYRTELNDNEVIALVKKYPQITAVTMWWDKRYSDSIKKRLEKEGVGVYVHTVNDQIQINRFLQKGVGVYTDVFPK